MTDQPLRIVFAGTPTFAAAHLQALLDHDFQMVGVFTQPDRPAGRGKQPKPSVVKQLALKHDLPVYQPASLRTGEARQALRDLAPDVMVVVAYGLLLPAEILAIPRYGCLNVHASLLPRWRGAAPVEHAILSGDTETGVSIMQMDEGLDTGDVLTTLSTPIQPDDTTATLAERLTRMGGEALVQTLREIPKGTLRPRPQDDAASTYAGKLSKEDALIDWHRPARDILRQINAFYPRSPAWCYLDGERIRIIEARVLEQARQSPPGTIEDAGKEGLRVAAGDQCLLVQRLQLPGKKAMAVQDVLNARRAAFAPGRRFTSQAAVA